MKLVKIITVGLTFSLSCSLAQNEINISAAFNKSNEWEKKKNYTAAIEILQEAKDNSYETNLRLGWLNYKAGLFTNSITYYENAINLQPGSVEAKMGYNYPAHEMGNDDKVITQYKKILEIDPQNTQVLFNLGSIYYYRNDLKSATENFEKIVALYPFDYDALNMLAWTNSKLNKKAEAKILFQKVLLNVPGDKAALDELSHINDGAVYTDKVYLAFVKNYECLVKPDYKAAIAALNGVYDSTIYELNVRLGWLNYAAGLQKEASTFYSRAIRQKPKAIEPRLGIVYPLAVMGNSNQVIEQYQAILAIDPQNSTANYRLGYIQYEKKDYDAANKYFEKIVKLYPFSYDGLLMFAWTQYRLGKTTEAKVLFGKVLMLSPNDKSALEGLALIK